MVCALPLALAHMLCGPLAIGHFVSQKAETPSLRGSLQSQRQGTYFRRHLYFKGQPKPHWF